MVANDEIWVSFTSKNQYNDNIFTDNLGWTYDDRMDCVELIFGTMSTDANTPLVCHLHKGDSTANINPVVKIQLSNTPTKGTTINFFINSVRNPNAQNIGATVILSHRRKCRNDGYMCAISESSDFYYTTSAPNVTRYTSNSLNKPGRVLGSA